MWTLVQRSRAVFVDAEQQDGEGKQQQQEDDDPGRRALRLLAECSVVGVVARVLMFVTGDAYKILFEEEAR